MVWSNQKSKSKKFKAIEKVEMFKMKSFTPVLDRVKAMRAARKSMEEYKMYCLAIARGATWGEVEVLTLEELMDLAIKPVVKNVKVAVDNRPLAKARIVQVKVREPPVQVQGKCLCCAYKVNPNPPRHFTAQQRLHCCGWCQVTNGREHGGHCMH
jgi:hypothetical protein